MAILYYSAEYFAMRKPEHKGILFLLPHLDLGGGARRIKVYCDNLDRRKYFPVVCIYSDQVLRNIDTVIGRGTPRLFSSDPEKIVLFCKEKNVQAVYTFYDGQYSETLFRMLSRLGGSGIKILTNNVFSYFNPLMDSLSDRVVFQTKMMLAVKFASRYTGWINMKKYGVLPNPVNTKYFQQFSLSPSQRADLRYIFGFTESDCIVARFGRNDIVKWGDILTATMLSRDLDHRVCFFIVGIPKSRRLILETLRRVSPRLVRRIVFVEPTGDDRTLMGWMQMVDIIGHGVKIGEGCSNAINEAMYWGKPVITNSTPHCDNGQIEQVDHGKTGYVANTAKEWVNTINFLAAHPEVREKLGATGHEKVVSLWNELLIVRTFEHYLDVMFGTASTPPEHFVTAHDLQDFRRWYDRFVRNHPTRKSSGLFSSLLDFLKRAADYIEYRISNV